MLQTYDRVMCYGREEESYLYEFLMRAFFLFSFATSVGLEFILFYFYFHFIRLVNVLWIKLLRSQQRQELTVKK